MGYVPWPWENLSITKFGYGQVKLRNSEFGFVQMSSITQYIICSTHTVTDWAGLLKLLGVYLQPICQRSFPYNLWIFPRSLLVTIHTPGPGCSKGG